VEPHATLTQRLDPEPRDEGVLFLLLNGLSLGRTWRIRHGSLTPAMLTGGYAIAGIEPHSAGNVTHSSSLSTATIAARRGGC